MCKYNAHCRNVICSAAGCRIFYVDSCVLHDATFIFGVVIMLKCAHKNALTHTQSNGRRLLRNEQRGDIEMYFCGWETILLHLLKMQFCSCAACALVIFLCLSGSSRSRSLSLFLTISQCSVESGWIAAILQQRKLLCVLVHCTSVPLRATPNAITQLMFGCNCHKWNRLMKRQCTIIFFFLQFLHW